jgi:RNA polymerase-binding transcription factor DksA
MQPAAMKKHRLTLEAVDRALTKELAWKRGPAHIKKLADRLVEMTSAIGYETALRRLNYRSALLLRVRAALRRIEAQSYGTCLLCSGEISPARLLKVPWAAFCATCRRDVDAQDWSAVASLGMRSIGNSQR